jgi:hypothetical protein
MEAGRNRERSKEPQGCEDVALTEMRSPFVATIGFLPSGFAIGF